MSALLELLKKKKQDIAASKRAKTAKFVDGRSRWRILPSWRGAGQQFWHDFGQHFVKNSAGEIQAIYVCSEKTFGKPCEVCSVVAQSIKAATDDSTLQLLQDAKSGARVLVNALQIDGPNPGEVQILEMPPSVFGMFVELAEEFEAAGQSILDANAGKDIIVGRTGKGKNTKYTLTPAAVSQPVPAGALDKLHDLDAYVASESSEAEARALTSVRSIAGLLPAPAGATRTSGLPLAAAGAATIVEEDMYAAAAPATTARPAAAAAATVTDVEVKVTAAAPVAAPAAAAPAAPAPAAAAAGSTGDPELDDLLNGLG
jgi:hypothetical protein